MKAVLYSIGLQFKLDIRSKSLLITCYLVPLLFYAVMGGIFTSIMPEAKATLIQSMTIMGVSMGAFIGLPPTLVEIYGSDIKKVYKANGIPLYIGVVSIFLSTFIHLMIMSMIIYATAPLFFKAEMPNNFILYLARLALFIFASTTIGCVLGLLVKNQSKLTMISQIFFLPSIMLSGIMFPSNLLPKALEIVGKIFPALWGFLLMSSGGYNNLWPLLIIIVIMSILIVVLFKKIEKE